jgi:YfiH family protein
VTDVPVIHSPLLSAVPGVRHAFFTRQGGVSTGVYASLNLGVGSKDDPAAVAENRRRVAGHFGAKEDHLLTVYQVHSATCMVVDAPGRPRANADAQATETPGLALGALAADCAPVLIADARRRIVGAAHAGWKGALGGVVEATVAEMLALGAEPEDLVAAVGPCIGPASYEVGLDFLETFQARDRHAAAFFGPGAADDKRQFDLPAYVLSRLARAGVANAEWTGHDTCADADRFHSNRRAFKQGEPDYGRLISVIMIEEADRRPGLRPARSATRASSGGAAL